MQDKYKEHTLIKYFHLWYTCAICIIPAIWIGMCYYVYPEYQQYIQRIVPYETILKFYIIMAIGLGLMIITTPISQLLIKNRRFQQWYIRYKEKEAMRKWRNNKSGI